MIKHKTFAPCYVSLDLTIGDNHKIDVPRIDMTIGEETIVTKILELEVAVEIEAEIE